MARQLSRFGLASVERIAAALIATSAEAIPCLLQPAEKEDKTTMLKILFE
jgi:hypothetical protein